MPASTAPDHITRLRLDALFAHLSGSQLARLLGGLQALEFAEGEQLYAAGAPAEFLFLIESGSLQLTTPAGRVVMLTEGRCGEEAATDAATYLCSVTATTPVSAIRIARSALHELAATAPGLSTQAWQSAVAAEGSRLVLVGALVGAAVGAAGCPLPALHAAVSSSTARADLRERRCVMSETLPAPSYRRQPGVTTTVTGSLKWARR